MSLPKAIRHSGQTSEKKNPLRQSGHSGDKLYEVGNATSPPSMKILRHLIAPCPDPEHKAKAGVWRVSSRVDDRKDSRRDLVGLAGRPVLEPSEAKFLPSLESLRWREQQLQGKY